MFKLTPFVAIMAAMFFISGNDAHAYLDPGTGSIFLQVILSVFFGAILMLKVFWQNIKAFVQSIFVRRSPDHEDQ
ncbi:hypothetical protein LLG95_16900 [bacterium]|nr:hypothetical protein [bacterium]